MLFQTWPFVIFFAIVYPAYLALKQTRFRLPFLLAASYFFYGWLNPLYVVLIAYSSALDYFVAARMEKGRHRRAWLAVSIVNNLGLLLLQVWWVRHRQR